MKSYEFPVDAFQAEWIFRPVRSKRDVIVLLINAVKVMMLPPLPLVNPAGLITLRVSKMSRLFFSSERKIFSINFPFSAIEVEGNLRFRTVHHDDIGSRVTSQILELVESSDIFSNRDVLYFSEPISDICMSDSDFWCLLRELILSEDGYIRYDHDEERADAQLHPLYHLDVCYSDGVAFKLGLKAASTAEQISDILNIRTNCHYLAGPDS